MDPTLNSLAYKFRAEMLAEPTENREHKSEWGKNLIHGLGNLLVAVGQRMQVSGLEAQAVFEDGGYSSLDNEMCA